MVAVVVRAKLGMASPCDNLTPMKIDDYLAARNSPLAGLGQHFIDEGDTFNIDPRLVVAIAQQETSLGTAGVCSLHNNPFNWFYCIACRSTCTRCSGDDPASVKCPLSAYPSWANAVSSVSRWLSIRYLDKGFDLIPEIGAKYCTQSCGDWVKNVERTVRALGGDPNHLRFKYPIDDFERGTLGANWTTAGIHAGGASGVNGCATVNSSSLYGDTFPGFGICYWNELTAPVAQYACGQLTGPGPGGGGVCVATDNASGGSALCCDADVGSFRYWEVEEWVNGASKDYDFGISPVFEVGDYIGIQRNSDGSYDCYRSTDGMTWATFGAHRAPIAMSSSHAGKPGAAASGYPGTGLAVWEGGKGSLPSDRACGTCPQ
jgi:hypothetical protein